MHDEFFKTIREGMNNLCKKDKLQSEMGGHAFRVC